MRTHRYIPYVAIMYLLTGCTRLREWERRGSPDNLPIEIRKKWYDEQRTKDLERTRQHYQWMQEEMRRR